jgi:hypothetical protein
MPCLSKQKSPYTGYRNDYSDVTPDISRFYLKCTSPPAYTYIKLTGRNNGLFFYTFLYLFKSTISTAHVTCSENGGWPCIDICKQTGNNNTVAYFSIQLVLFFFSLQDTDGNTRNCYATLRRHIFFSLCLQTHLTKIYKAPSENIYKA